MFLLSKGWKAVRSAFRFSDDRCWVCESTHPLQNRTIVWERSAGEVGVRLLKVFRGGLVYYELHLGESDGEVCQRVGTIQRPDELSSWIELLKDAKEHVDLLTGEDTADAYVDLDEQ